jgi:hypothetical protein
MLPLIALGLMAAVAHAADTTPLTGEQVADYIQTRIETAKLQNRMRANADEYQDVVHAFYRERGELLHRRGWTEDGFDDTQKRIIAAESAMEEAENLKQVKRQDRETLESMRKAGYIPEDRLAEMERAMAASHKQQSRQIEETRPDWPAVRPYRDKLRQLTDWIAGNVPNPPSL